MTWSDLNRFLFNICLQPLSFCLCPSYCPMSSSDPIVFFSCQDLTLKSFFFPRYRLSISKYPKPDPSLFLQYSSLVCPQITRNRFLNRKARSARTSPFILFFNSTLCALPSALCENLISQLATCNNVSHHFIISFFHYSPIPDFLASLCHHSIISFVES